MEQRAHRSVPRGPALEPRYDNGGAVTPALSALPLGLPHNDLAHEGHPPSAKRVVARPSVLRTALGVVVASALLSGASCALASHLLLNLTRSMPLGLDWLHRGGPVRRGDLVTFRVPAEVRSLVRERHYLLEGALLLKPVAAVAGDTVCIVGDELAIDGRAVARLRGHDSDGRPLPREPAAVPSQRSMSTSRAGSAELRFPRLRSR